MDVICHTHASEQEYCGSDFFSSLRTNQTQFKMSCIIANAFATSPTVTVIVVVLLWAKCDPSSFCHCEKLTKISCPPNAEFRMLVMEQQEQTTKLSHKQIISGKNVLQIQNWWWEFSPVHHPLAYAYIKSTIKSIKTAHRWMYWIRNWWLIHARAFILNVSIV